MDIQRFTEDGTWRKPPGAVRVDMMSIGGGGGGSAYADGEPGQLTCRSVPADEIPDEVEVIIGKGGRGAVGCGDGADGYAVFVTHLKERR